MRAWRSRLVLLVGIGLLPLEITFIIALWPYLSIMGKAAIGLFVVGCVCGSIWIIALAYHQIALMRIRRQREYFSRRYIVAGNVVAYHQEDSDPRNLSAEQESAKLIAAPRVQVSEETPTEGEPDHWRILELAGKGVDLRTIATVCNTTYYRVQKITSAWKQKIEEAG